jgi:hypothetical protein
MGEDMPIHRRVLQFIRVRRPACPVELQPGILAPTFVSRALRDVELAKFDQIAVTSVPQQVVSSLGKEIGSTARASSTGRLREGDQATSISCPKYFVQQLPNVVKIFVGDLDED